MAVLWADIFQKVGKNSKCMVKKLNLQGKKTIIKSLAWSKFVHLLLALPNPPGNSTKTQIEVFYKFLWYSGPDRIKRKLLWRIYLMGA